MLKRSNRIKILAAERNLSVAELAKMSGVQPHNLRRYARQEAQPRLEIAQQIAEALGVSLDDVMGTKLGSSVAPPGAREGRRIPVYGAAQGGLGHDITDVSSPVDYLAAPEWVAGNDNSYAVLVSGESMEPRFFAGEVLFVHPGLPPTPGDDVVIQIAEGQETHAVVKRLVRRSNGKIICQQFNPAAEVVYDAAAVVAVHRVVGVRIGQ